MSERELKCKRKGCNGWCVVGPDDSKAGVLTPKCNVCGDPGPVYRPVTNDMLRQLYQNRPSRARRR